MLAYHYILRFSISSYSNEFYIKILYKFIVSYSVRRSGFHDSQERLTKLNNIALSCYGPPIKLTYCCYEIYTFTFHNVM